MGINEEFLYSTLHTMFTQPQLWVTVKFLGDRVVDSIVHVLTNPQLTVKSLKHFVDIVTAKCGSVLGNGIERLETVAVIAVQTIGRTKPHKTFGIAENTDNLRIAQTVTRIQPAEFHVVNNCNGRNRYINYQS